MKHSWLAVVVANTTTKHAICRRCHTKRTIELRGPRRYCAKDEAVWKSQPPPCAA